MKISKKLSQFEGLNDFFKGKITYIEGVVCSLKHPRRSGAPSD